MNGSEQWIWKTSGLALAACALATPAMAIESYSADANYCVSSPNTAADCILNRVNNQSTPVVVSAGHHAEAGAYGGGGGLALATVTFAPTAPSLLDGKTYSATANAVVSYTVQVKGRPNVYVPVLITGDVTAGAIHATDIYGQVLTVADNPDVPGPDDGLSQPSNYQIAADAWISIFQPSTNTGLDRTEVYSSLAGDRNRSSHMNGDSQLINRRIYLFLSNTDINVTLSSQVSLNYLPVYDVGTSTQFGVVTASADPTFTIEDPAFSDFSILGVPSAVPEPASWMLMAIGLGILLLVRRRHGPKFVSTGCRNSIRAHLQYRCRRGPVWRPPSVWT